MKHIELGLSENIPVLLLTGYLGSGKTTLLNRILSNRKGIRFAVIVNDIGEVNIDAELIQKGGVVAQSDDNLIALQNGCICCSLKMDLVEQLRDLCIQQCFDYIVIEASGICEPAPIAQTICSYNNLIASSCHCQSPKLDAVVTVVDALRLRDEFISQLSTLNSQLLPTNDLASLVVEQIEFCNVILLNKVSEVSLEERGQIRAILRAIQPKAKIIDCDYCDVPFGEILDTELFNFDEVATSATWIQKVEGDVEEEHHHHHHDCFEHEDHHHEHCHCHDHHPQCDDPHCHCHEHNHGDEFGISTFVYYRRQPMDLNRFDEFVARYWPKGVIRCKGMCYFKDEYDMCYVFEQAGSQFNLKQAGNFYATMPENELMQLMAQDTLLQRDWDEQYGDRMQKLVFIGQYLDKEKICEALDQCLVD
ncbi:MAG: GTP-binding protein [Paludibacteraceae bacterium]|nr:GTP-binding protein [Paludibacteraceae bacterium]